jgi:3-keto-L-gulonate-6-phosphate decarboxylase
MDYQNHLGAQSHHNPRLVDLIQSHNFSKKTASPMALAIDSICAHGSIDSFADVEKDDSIVLVRVRDL